MRELAPSSPLGIHDRIGFFVLVLAAIVAVVALSLAVASRSAVKVERLMADTAHETDLFIYESGQPGQNVLVLGGVHGDEPASWLAAEALLDRGPPHSGRLLVLPRANIQAVERGVRSTPEIGDLNRLYFADHELFPMARMAREIVEAVRRHDINAVIDLHESWDFYQPNATTRLSALGQTISPHSSEPSRQITALLVEEVNRRLPTREQFHYHEFPSGHVDELIVPLPEGITEDDVPRKSGMDIAESVPGLASILVEVGQQQSLHRRVSQHVAVVEALLALLQSDYSLLQDYR